MAPSSSYASRVLARPLALLLDAGNTLVFLDHDALAATLHQAGFRVTGKALAAAEPVAKRRYEEALARADTHSVSGEGGRSAAAAISHEDGWSLHMRVLFEAAGMDAASAAAAVAPARAAHDSFNFWRLIPDGLPAHLARARAAGLRLAVVSNSEGKLAELFVRVGLDQAFELVVDSGLEGVRKPDPEIFRRALVRMDLPPESCVYAGDIPDVDVGGARAAGMAGVLIDTRDHYPAYCAAPRFSSVSALLRHWGIP